MKTISRVAIAAAMVLSSLTIGLATTSVTTAAAAGCSLSSTNGSVNKFIGARSYRLHVPAGLTGTQVPLLIDLHGGGGNAETYEQLTGWSTYADAKKNFIVAYPNSQMYGWWNYGPGSADVTFVKQVVDHIAATYCVDPRRVFVDGHSNGGVMADRLACDAAHKFAAFAPYAGASAQQSLQPSGIGGCTPSRPVPIAMFHGDADTQAPISYQQANRDWWIGTDGCATSPQRSTDQYGSLDKYTPCAGGAEIWWRVYAGGSHAWPTGAQGNDQRDRMWQFFNAHPLP